KRSMLCPSTPAAPPLALTSCQALASVSGRRTLSIKLNHLLPLTPLPSAANIRAVQITRSTHGQFAGADASCLASCRDTSDALLARSLICPSRIHLPASLPSARVVVSGPFALHVTPQAESALPLVGAAFPTAQP